MCVDGQPVRPQPTVLLALHKPWGVVSTARDPRGRPTVVEVVPASLGRLYPVGRLDRDSEGLILLGNNGPLTNALLHPRHRVPRIYHLLVRPVPSDQDLGRLRSGVRLSDGFCRAAEARLLLDHPSESDMGWMQLVLHDGRNREARRMCAALGIEVVRLIRVSFGSVRLGDLPPGGYRVLTEAEVGNLWRDARGAGQRR